MHPLESGMGVPAFLAKLWRLVEDSETNNLISWSSVNILLFLNSKFGSNMALWCPNKAIQSPVDIAFVACESHVDAVRKQPQSAETTLMSDTQYFL